MNTRFFYAAFTLCLFVVGASAQVFTFQDDSLQRGYYNRPYQRYEAESNYCISNANFLPPTFHQDSLQSEATNQSAVQLRHKNDYVAWTVGQAGNGLTIRFSLPDNIEGKGTIGNLALYVNDEYVQDIVLNSYWAWQYTAKNGSNKYPDNTPVDTKFARMRFDEMHVLLPHSIDANATLKLVKTDDNAVPYTLDFVELETVSEPLTFDDITDENKVEYMPSKGYLSTFIANNAGKTIFLPAGRYEVGVRLYLNTDNTKLIGAGMWHTEIYFSASSDVRSTHSNRGIEANGSNLVVEGIFLNTVNNKRYYDNNSNYQVGKGFMGGWGSNSIIRNCWVEHFECGAWIANYGGCGSNNLRVEHCRFRNNYADGINLCQGSTGHCVQYCSFRNNGDDDMASWSVSEMCSANIFAYNTAENNWRASSLGFFGGKNQSAHHCLIIDPMECGVRVNADFSGTGFSGDGVINLYDISIYRAGCASGTVGISGDFWGNMQGAFNIGSTGNYNVSNIHVSRINLYASKNDAFLIAANNGHQLTNIQLNDIYIDGTGRYGIYYSNPRGNGTFCNINYQNIGMQNNNSLPSVFSFVEDCHTAVESVDSDGISVIGADNTILISGKEGQTATIYNLLGNCLYEVEPTIDTTSIDAVQPGIYLVHLLPKKKVVKLLVF